ncbi:MAG: phenylalanine--tRNA ligase subunit beta [Owenweeksia sp.]
MKISYNWLKDYIQTDLSPEAMAEILTDTGLEVEGIETFESVKGGLRGIVIGEVLTCVPHPNADRLKKTTVHVGGDKPLHIVCGAPNVAAGQKVPVATIGTILYDGKESFEIRKSKIRGEVSEGMICAEDELNLGESHNGIMILDDSAKAGTSASEYFNVQTDYIIEIGLTPNRTDAMSHYGVARDLRAALIRHGHTGVEIQLPSVGAFTVDNTNLPIQVHIENSDACPRYAGVSLTDVKVGPSPEWLQNRLKAIGIGPINNIVDITNYVLHETGHPLHAFDADQISGNKVVVKTLPAGTTFTTLDEKERELHQDDLMICNEKEGMCIAGVFGGLKSGVTEATNRIFLESAYFNPVSIRKTAKRHGLNTDASFRYERGVDPEMEIYALKRAALLIRELAGGKISMDICDENPNPVKGFEVQLNLDNMTRLIGQEIEADMVHTILNTLDIRIKAESGKNLVLDVPAYRADVQREVDVIEEILRIYGFNAIHIDDKMNISVAQTDTRDEARYREKISETMSSRGFAEIMNNSLTKSSYFEQWGFNPAESVVMLNPLSQDLNAMRQSLLFGGLESVARNSNRQRPDLRLFEFGKTYFKSPEAYTEKSRMGIWVSGKEEVENWKTTDEPSDFYTLKNQVNYILSKLGLDTEEKESDNPLFEYALGFFLHQREVISMGKVKGEITRQLDIRQDVFFADLDWSYLAQKARKQKIMFSELPKYPEVRRDLALLLDKEVAYTDLKNIAEKTERKLLRKVNLFDVYEGKNLPAGKKSYALSFTLRDDEKTLNDKQVDKVMGKILDRFKKDFSAELR